MTELSTGPKRVAVVGGGISGLTAAHRVHELLPTTEVRLFEASSSLGGVLQTVRQDGYLIERGADNFITTPTWGIELCRRLGLGDQLLQTNHQHRHAFVVCRGRLRRIPEGFVIMAPSRIWPVVVTPILSPWGKLRMACEYFIRQRDDPGDESLESFVTRRFGRETYDRLVQPLIGGIYTGDPEKLSVCSTMPRFRDMERNHGSLIRAVWKQSSQPRSQMQGGSGARYSMFMTLRDGISSLIDTLAARLPAGTIRTAAAITRVARDPDGGWQVSVGGASPETMRCDAVILAPKATVAAPLVADIHPTLSANLAAIPHASCSVVALGYRRDQIAHAMDGFGFVVPRIENRRILSGSFSSVKYPGRAPEGCALVRAFIGGELQPELAALPDDELTRIARQELGQLLGISGEPNSVLISRFDHAMPQYHVGHSARIEQIEASLGELPGLFFTGNAFGGVGMPFCIHKSEKTAEAAVDYLRGTAAAEAGSAT